MTRGRRWGLRVALILGALVLIFLLSPWLLAPLGGLLVEGEWGSEVDVEKARWRGGKRIVLEGVDAYMDGQDEPFIRAEIITVDLENNPITGDPGLLLLGVLEKATLSRHGKLATFEKVTYERNGDRRSLTFEGLDAEVDWSDREAWAEAIDRIITAPGIAPEGGGPLLEKLQIEDSRVAVAIDWRAEKRRIPIRVDHLEFGGRPDDADVFDLVLARGGLLGGDFSAFGLLDFSDDGKSEAQLNLVRLDFAAAGELELIAAESKGQADAFVQVEVDHASDELKGAGWVEGREVRVWEEPHLSKLLDQLGFAAADHESLEELKGSLRFDRGRIYLTEMICIGSPLNLFGNGSCKMDGSDLEVGLVPRIVGEDMDQSADAPQLLLDVISGSIVEIRVTGQIKEPEVEVVPLAVVTDPLRAFLDLFSSDDDEEGP